MNSATAQKTPATPKSDENILHLNSFQTLMHSVPGQVSIAACTGRGVGKSTGFATLMLRGCEQYQRDYRALYLRKSYKGLADYEAVLLDIFTRAYGRRGFSYNLTDRILRTPAGAYIELGELSGPEAYDKYQGRSFVEIYVDEAQQHAEPRILDLLMSNLRSPVAPTRMLLGANPLGPGHEWIRQRFIDRAAPWTPFKVNGRKWIRGSGNYEMNDMIDREEYLRNLLAATAGDSARRKAWVEGDFNVDAGAFFARAYSEARNLIETSPDEFPTQHLWEWSLSHDWGFSAPSVTLLLAEAMDSMWGPDDRYYPKGSIIVADEYATNEKDSLNIGQRLSIPELAEGIHDMLRPWRFAKPKGVADDAITAPRGDQPRTFQAEFKRCGINFKPAKKGERIPSIARLVRYLAAAGSLEQPGLYINRSRCPYLVRTLPIIQRSETNPEDTDSEFDHGMDALRYGLTPDRSGEAWCVTQRFDI